MVATAPPTPFKHRFSKKFYSLARVYKTNNLVASAQQPRKELSSTAANLFSAIRGTSIRTSAKALPSFSSGYPRSLSRKPAHTAPRKVIRVAKLNFGPYQPDSLRAPLDSLLPTYHLDASPNAALDGVNITGLGLSLSVIAAPANPTEGDLGREFTVIMDDARGQELVTYEASAERSVYSQESWVNGPEDRLRIESTSGSCSTISILESLGDRQAHSGSCSAALDPPVPIVPFVGARNGTYSASSSFDEESFMRLAITDLDW